MKRFLYSLAALSVIATSACGGSPTSPDGPSGGGTGGCIVLTGNTATSFNAAGGSAAIAITTTSDCAWHAVSSASFLTITSGASGTGSGAVVFSVAVNTGPARTAGLTIVDTNNAYADTVVTIFQSAP